MDRKLSGKIVQLIESHSTVDSWSVVDSAEMNDEATFHMCASGMAPDDAVKLILAIETAAWSQGWDAGRESRCGE